ncbi:uncharacterized protein LOC106666938 [Cimex lectularius]|uniref:Uncharacterized protein n=1 Tax=Cimex lectularius TaxID=79782 RepID=A0A8I6RNY1_CIMLE|nr:uncharacterized protein LOC106666938 [Cimex lectularius]
MRNVLLFVIFICFLLRMLFLLILNLFPKVGSVRSDISNLIGYSDDMKDLVNLGENHFVNYDFERQHPQILNKFSESIIPGYDNQHSLDRFSNYYSQPDIFVKAKKKKRKRKHKYLVPLLIMVISKLGHFLPTLKLTLFALFTLILFAKKAFLVSVGSLLLVVYDHVYKNKKNHSIWKEWNQRNQPAKQDQLDYLEDTKNDWWETKKAENQTINPREADKWRRWWKYYEPID